MEHTLSTSLTVSGRSLADGLIIEQEGYGATDGWLSRAGMYRGILALLNGEEIPEPECTPNCGTRLFVYRYDLGLAYQLHVSHGRLGERRVEDHYYYTEKLKVSMSREVQLRYPCLGMIEHRWVGNKVWDGDGSETTAPQVTTSIDRAYLSKICYGTLLLTYRIHRHSYTLALPKREDTEENKYACVAYALHRTGPTWIEVQPPPGAEEMEQQCSGGGGGLDIPDKPEPDREPPYAPNVDAEIKIDYCSQEVISDSTK